MKFLEGFEDNEKLPVALSLETFYAYMQSLYDNKRFNHDELQILSDYGAAIILDIMQDDATFKINTDDFFRLFFLTTIRELGETRLSTNYGSKPVYRFVREHLVKDNGTAVRKDIGDDVEEILAESLISRFKDKFVKK